MVDATVTAGARNFGLCLAGLGLLTISLDQHIRQDDSVHLAVARRYQHNLKA